MDSVLSPGDNELATSTEYPSSPTIAATPVRSLAEACVNLGAGDSIIVGSKRYPRVEGATLILKRHAATYTVPKLDAPQQQTGQDKPLSNELLSTVYAVLGEALERQAAGKDVSTVESSVKVPINPVELTKDEKRRQVGISSQGFAYVRMNPAQCLHKALELDIHNARAWYVLGCVVSNLHMELSMENDLARDGDNAGTLSSRRIRKIALESKVRRGGAGGGSGGGVTTEETTIKLPSGRFTATNCFTQAVSLNPKLSGAWLNLGSAMAHDAARHAALMRAQPDAKSKVPTCVIAGEVISRESCYLKEILIDFRTPIEEKEDPNMRPPAASVLEASSLDLSNSDEPRPHDEVPRHRRRARAFAWLNLAGCLRGHDDTITVKGISFTRKKCLVQSIVEYPHLSMAWTNLAANMYGEEVALIPSPTIPGHNVRAGRVECLIRAIELANNNKGSIRQPISSTAYPWVNIAAVLFEEMLNDGRFKRSECTLLPLTSSTLAGQQQRETPDEADERSPSIPGPTDRLFDCIDCIEEALTRDPKHYMGWYNAAMMMAALEEDRNVHVGSEGSLLVTSTDGDGANEAGDGHPRRPTIRVGGVTYPSPINCLIQSLTIEEEHGDAWFQLGQHLYYSPRDPTGDATAEVNGQTYNAEECYSRATQLGSGSRTRCCSVQ